jgi:DNA modification methylase
MNKLIIDDCMTALRAMEDNSIDAVVTDPPYGLSPDRRARTWDDVTDLRKGRGFMGKAWDHACPGVTWAREVYRVLKPGGHLIAFGATRTIHRLTTALEDAGFEIRDQISWLRWTGFPKSHDVSKAIDREAGAEREIVGRKAAQQYNYPRTSHPAHMSRLKGQPGSDGPNHKAAIITAPATDDACTWSGWGTALKPASEPCILVRKPLEKGLTVSKNVLKWRTGALNIDACRIPYGDKAWPGPQRSLEQIRKMASPNIRAGKVSDGTKPSSWHVDKFGTGPVGTELGRWPANIYHCPSASKRERDAGMGDIPPRPSTDRHRMGDFTDLRMDRPQKRQPSKNNHPTLKPVGLIKWLVTLVTPPGGTVLDPFVGSGTIYEAARELDCSVIGIERDQGYAEIARARMDYAAREA